VFIKAKPREHFEIETEEMPNLKWETYDHEFMSLFCDPNFTPYDEPLSMSKGPNSVMIKCLYNKKTVEHSLNYLKSYWTAYENQPKYFRLSIVDAHEGTYESIKYDDLVLTKFFTEFEKIGALKDTILIVQTDHGNTQPGPYSLLYLDDFTYELSLPALYVLTPNDKKYYEVRKDLKSNEQAFITPFTLHNSMIQILNVKEFPFSVHDNSTI